MSAPGAERRIRLAIVGGEEDLPRLVTAYGRLPKGTRFRGGEAALVLRPIDGEGIFVRIEQPEVRGGEPDVRVWKADRDGDAPRWPARRSNETRVASAIARLRRPTEPRPVVHRGRWSGLLVVTDGAPRVELRRKVSSWGLLTLVSVEDGWTVRFERQERWFSKPAVVEPGTAPTLTAAVEMGCKTALELLGPAAAKQAVTRRAALDAAYAEKHPIRRRDPARDPSARFTEKLRTDKEAEAELRQPATHAERPTTHAAATSKQSATHAPERADPAKTPAKRKEKAPKPPNPPAEQPPPSSTDEALMAAFTAAIRAAVSEDAA